ncbi:glycosyltransferase [Alteromonas australica]|uniref:glycosyltransferase n=1 Tax=Alteromonas australica TaxID=589873 RepID=UPI003F674470
MKKVTYILKSFPVLSQTFVIDQINNLIASGYDVKIISIFSEKVDAKLQENVEKFDLLSRTEFVCQGKSKHQKALSLLFALAKSIINYRQAKPVLGLFTHLLKCKDFKSAIDTVRLYNHFAHHSSLPSEYRNGVFIAHFGQFGVMTQASIDARAISGKLLTVFHGYEMSEYAQINVWKKKYTELCKGNNQLLPISDFWKSRLVEWGADSSYISVMHMGVDVQTLPFNPKPFKKNINILTVARATEKKGLTYAFEAVSLGLSFPYEYNYIGNGQLLQQLKDQVEQANTENINFLGARSHSEVKEYLRKADIFLLPSVIDTQGDMEGIPVSLMEAMAAGIIVISTEHSGIPELIENGVNGFLAPEKDAVALNKIINQAVSRADLAQIRENARKKVEDEFNSVNLTQELINFIEQ